jgi:hypothetical protein
MATPKMAPISVRGSRVVVVPLVVLTLAATSGCGHRRSAMRPAYGGTVVTSPGIVTSPTVVPSTPGTVQGGAIPTEPGLGGDPILAPINPSNGPDGVNRTGGSPPVPAEAEPTLSNPSPSAPGSSKANTPGEVEMIKPSASRSVGRSASVSVSGKTSRAQVREAVLPYLAEPDDLFQPPRADRPWKYIVVHHSANATGGLDQIDRDHRKILGFEGCGYHFVIGNGTDSPDGQIEIANRWLDQKNGVHCRNGRDPEVNEYGIGICLIGNLDQAEPTPKQVAAARALVAYLAQRYQVPGDRVGSHDRFADGPTACPGKYFPSQAIFGSNHMAAR